MITVQYLNGSSQHDFNITSWNTIQNIQILPLKFYKSHSTFQLPQHPYDLLRMNEFIQLALSNYNRIITTTDTSNINANTYDANTSNPNTSNSNTSNKNKRRKNSSSSKQTQQQQTLPTQTLTYQDVLKFWNAIIQKSEKGLIVDDHPLIHPTFIRDQYNNTVAMLLAQKGLSIPSWWKHDIDLTNIFGDTIALIYARCGFIPPYEWCYTQPTSTSIQIASVSNKQNKKFKIKQRYNKVCLQNPIDKRTCMMLYILYYLKSQKHITQQDIIQLYKQLPAYCRHSSSFKDFNGQTIAHMLASYGIVPPKMFKHNPNISDKFLNSVSTYLIQKQVHVPKEWIAKTNQRYTSEFNTQAMLYIISNSITPIISSDKHCFYHDPSIQNGEGMTVAMLYASKGIIPPECWRHDPSIKNKYGLRVYDILKQQNEDKDKDKNNDKINIPIYWRPISSSTKTLNIKPPINIIPVMRPLISPTLLSAAQKSSTKKPTSSQQSSTAQKSSTKKPTSSQQSSTTQKSSTKKLSLLDYPTSLHPTQQNEENGFEPLQTPTTNMSGVQSSMYSSMHSGCLCSCQSSTRMDEQYNKVIKRYQNMNEVINTSSYNDYSRHLINSSPKQHSIQEYTKQYSKQQHSIQEYTKQHSKQQPKQHTKQYHSIQEHSIQEYSNQGQYIKAQNILNSINNKYNNTSQKRK